MFGEDGDGKENKGLLTERADSHGYPPDRRASQASRYGAAGEAVEKSEVPLLPSPYE